MSHRQYTAAVGTKFHADGSVRAFPGFSLVSYVTPDMPQYQLLAWFQDDLKNRTFAGCFGFLPPESWHMTVKDLVCDQVRVPEHWSRDWPLDLPLFEVENRLVKLLEKVVRPCSLSLRFDTLLHYETTIKPYVQPADTATGEYLREFRETVSAETGIRHPNHHHYRFHLSLAYQLLKLDTAEKDSLVEMLRRWEDIFQHDFGTLVLAEPKLVTFPDMFSFPPAGSRRAT